MLPRHKLDISYSNLINTFFHLFTTKNHIINFEKYFPSKRKLFYSLSVRTTWDIILTTLKLPENSEILISNLTVIDMVKIILHHKLIPVPINFKTTDLNFDYQEIISKITKKTKIILIAHLFGAKSNLESIKRIKDEYPDLIIIEDLAQSFADGHKENEWVDISLYSFGTIKTLTALGGSIALFKDNNLYEKTIGKNNSYSEIKKSIFIKKIFKVLSLKILSNKIIYSIIFKLSNLLKINLDTLLSNSVKGFPGKDLILQIRKKPIQSMAWLLERQLKNKEKSIIFTQKLNGENLVNLLKNSEKIYGSKNSNCFYWILAYQTENSENLIHKLREHGFDANKRASQMCRITQDYPNHSKNLDNIIYLPINYDLKTHDVKVMANLINNFDDSTL